MFRVDIADEAKEEIQNLFKVDSIQARRLVVVLEELDRNEGGLENLIEDGFFCDDFDVKHVRHFQHRERKNVWRLKVFGYSERRGDFVLDYRVIYAPDFARNTIQILGIMHQSVDYEKDKQFVAEIVRRYEQLGLPLLPRG
jgi:mRNA-degrading endonuclease RelE of RelBE toxin-antitoxin system